MTRAGKQQLLVLVLGGLGLFLAYKWAQKQAAAGKLPPA